MFADTTSSSWPVALAVTIVGGVIVGVIVHLLTHRGKKNDNRTGDNFQEVRGNNNVVVGGDIIFEKETQTTNVQSEDIPEFHLQLYGSGAKSSFEGHIEKKSAISLVITSVEIDSFKTEINQSFTKLMHLTNLRYDPTLFTKQKTGDVQIRVHYRKMDGTSFVYTTKAKQELRADKKYNVRVIGTPLVERLTNNAESTRLLGMNPWTAKPTQEEQGTSWKEFSLAGHSITKAIFTITPTTSYWRAGFKLLDPNGSIMPLLSDGSLLFHLGSQDDDNKFGITVYINGGHIGAINKTRPFSPGEEIEIGFEVTDKNFIRVYVNNSLEFEPAERINPRLLKKACLIAWGDGQHYNVRFDDIKFLNR